MAEPDAAGQVPAVAAPPTATTGNRPTTLAQAQRDVERSLAPLRAAQKAAEEATAPLRAMAEATAKVLAPFQEIERERKAMLEKAFAPVREFDRYQKAIASSIDAGIGSYLRGIMGVPALIGAPAAPADGAADSPAPRSPPTPVRESAPPPPPRPATARQDPAFVVSPAAMSALVERVAEEVVKRLAAAHVEASAHEAKPAKSQRGRRRRNISVGGVDAALEALAEEDPSVRALAARDLIKRGIPYSRRCIEACPTYRAWRMELKRLRMGAAEADMANVLDAGLARIRKKKPGRGRLVDPTLDLEVEKMTKEFLRLHGEEGLDGQ